MKSIQNLWWLAALSALALLAVGCGGGNGVASSTTSNNNNNTTTTTTADMALATPFSRGSIPGPSIDYQYVDVAVPPGATSSVTLEIRSVSGIQGPVQLTGKFSTAGWSVKVPDTVTVAAGKTTVNAQITTPTLASVAGSPLGLDALVSNLTLTAVGGGLTRAITVTVYLQGVYFATLSTPAARVASPSVFDANLTITPRSDFAGTVTVTPTTAITNGFTALPPTTTFSGGTTVTFAAGDGPKTVPIVITLPAWATPGIYNFSVDANSSVLNQRVSGQVSLFTSVVAPFDAKSNGLAPVAGQSGTYETTVTLTPAAGLVGDVTFTSSLNGFDKISGFPAGTTLTGVPTTLHFTGTTGVQTFKLTLTLPAKAPSGTYGFTVTPSFGSYSVILGQPLTIP